MEKSIIDIIYIETYFFEVKEKIELFYSHSIFIIQHMQPNNNNNMQNTMNPVPVYFKEAWTTNTKIYLLYPDWTLNQFRDALKPLIAIDFNMEPDEFDLIHVGQAGSENGDPCPHSNDIKLKDLWTPQLNIGFYIRR